MLRAAERRGSLQHRAQTPQPGPTTRAPGQGRGAAGVQAGGETPGRGGIFSDLLKALVTAGKIELPLLPGFPRYLLARSV